MSERPQVENVDQYIQSFNGTAREYLLILREIIYSEVPQAAEKISYGIPTFTIVDKNLIHYAAFAKHVGIYPAPREAEEFKSELEAYRGGKGTVQFPFNEPLPEELIRRIVRYRLMVHKTPTRRS